jgi:uncharacterized caspase-like protein
MMGSSAITFSGLNPRSGAALGHQAIMVPMMVVPVAVSRRENKVFQATPQRTPPVTQLKPQTRSWPTRSKIAPSDQLTVFVQKAPYSALSHRKGDEQCQQHRAAHHAAATNRSPLKKPRRAMPKAVHHDQ